MEQSTQNGAVYTEWSSLHRMEQSTHNGAVYTEWSSLHRMEQYTQNGAVYTEWCSLHRMEQSTHNGAVYTEWSSLHRMEQSTQNGAVYTESYKLLSTFSYKSKTEDFENKHENCGDNKLLLYSFFCVIFVCRRFGTFFKFQLHRWCKLTPPMKIDLTGCSKI
jgi:fumarate reductase subunit D